MLGSSALGLQQTEEGWKGSAWKPWSPSSAAQLHLDSSSIKDGRVSPDCTDSYLCNWFPVREELGCRKVAALPAARSKTGDALQKTAWSARAFRWLPKEAAARAAFRTPTSLRVQLQDSARDLYKIINSLLFTKCQLSITVNTWND